MYVVVFVELLNCIAYRDNCLLMFMNGDRYFIIGYCIPLKEIFYSIAFTVL